MYRKAAVELEEKRKNQKAEQASGKPICCASTNTLPTSPGKDKITMTPPPISVTGRSRQQLQFSETLIYDNKQNSIIKFVKSCRSGRAERDKSRSSLLKTLRSQHLPEAPAPMWPQSAVIREEPLTCQSATIILAPSAKPSLVKQSPKPSRRSLPKPTPLKVTLLGNASAAPCEETITDLLNVARKLNKQSYNAGRALHRSNTSPALSPLIALQSSCSSGNDHDERILWKRYNSYPPHLSKLPSPLAEATVPISPNTSVCPFCQSVNKPWLPITITSSSTNSNKLPSTPTQPQPEEKIIAKTLNGSQLKNASTSTGSSNKESQTDKQTHASCLQHGQLTAHASSHAHADGTNSDNGTRMSSTQRRLSYNPRATLQRATLQRATRRQRSSTSSRAGETSQTLPCAPSTSSCDHTDMMRRKMQGQRGAEANSDTSSLNSLHLNLK